MYINSFTHRWRWATRHGCSAGADGTKVGAAHHAVRALATRAAGAVPSALGVRAGLGLKCPASLGQHRQRGFEVRGAGVSAAAVRATYLISGRAA